MSEPIDPRAMRVLRQFVETDRLLGVEAVPVGREVVEVRDDRCETASDGAGIGVVGEHPLFQSGAIEPVVELTRDQKLHILTAIDNDEVKVCVKCDLCRSRTNTVFGEGDADAKLMFIGEGPGENEDLQGRPFVGRSGELLDKMIAGMTLSRDRVYIANVVKCRPPNNRTPSQSEADTCWGYLRRQIETIRPRVIVTLGGPAAKLLLNPQQGITSIRGTWHSWQPTTGPAIPVMPTFHPAYLLRSYTPENRAKVWSDLKKAMEVIGLKPAEKKGPRGLGA